jgi:hypothetical protein
VSPRDYTESLAAIEELITGFERATAETKANQPTLYNQNTKPMKPACWVVSDPFNSNAAQMSAIIQFLTQGVFLTVRGGVAMRRASNPRGERPLA